MFGVAEEVETSGAGPRIENEKQFKQWLEETRPAPDVCVALAARAALRALPFIHHYKPNSYFTEDFYESVRRLFRATTVSLIVAKYPGAPSQFGNRLSIDNALMVHKAEAPIIGSNSGVVWAATYAVYIASLKEKSLSANVPTESKILESTFYAVASANLGILFVVSPQGQATLETDIKLSKPTFFTSADQTLLHPLYDIEEKQPETAVWRLVEQDFQLISYGASARQLADVPLWHGTPPNFVSDSWRRLATALPETDDWWVWKNWYEDILNGKAHGEAHDMIYATVPVEEWDKGPAAANKWIAERLAELGEQNSLSDTSLNDFPKPLDDVPSLFTFGLNNAGQIDVVAGPQNTPVIGFAGDEATHRQWLETARELARRLAVDLRDDKFGNVRRDYADGLVRYAGDLPIEIGEGNFLLADHEIIAIHDLFGAEAAILPESLGARLNRVLKAHYSLLDFYPETKRYHEAAQKGRLSPPAPEEAFAGFEKVVREFTPEIFAPRVTQEIEAASYEAPRVEIDEEDRKLHAAIGPAPYPFENGSLKEQRYGKASTCNAILKAVNNPERINAYWDLGIKLKPYWEQIEPFLASLLN